MKRSGISLGLLILICAAVSPLGAQEHATATPPQLVAAYDSLADTILGAKATEWNLVHSIVATTYGHAEAAMGAAKAKLAAGEDARAEVEQLAALVAQLGNEGDASVAAIRKRLLEGGHHHHAQAEQEGKYDEGFVIVTRVARKAFLDSAKKIGQLAAKPDAAALEAEWMKVVQEFKKLHKEVAGMG